MHACFIDDKMIVDKSNPATGKSIPLYKLVVAVIKVLPLANLITRTNCPSLPLLSQIDQHTQSFNREIKALLPPILLCPAHPVGFSFFSLFIIDMITL